MNRVMFAACGLCASTVALASVPPVLVDFEADAMGNPLASGVGFNGDEYQALPFGVLISSGTARVLNLFDSTPPPAPTGGDGDLETGPAFNSTPQNLVLIAQDKGVPLSDPDDFAGGATFVFDFLNVFGVEVTRVGLLDLEEANVPNFSAVELGGGSSDPVTESGVILENPPFTGDNSFRIYEFDMDNPIEQFTVEIAGASGALAFIEFKNIPVPAPGSAALAGIACLAMARRRR